MKIGIITYHRATNYGAVLQAYSLVNNLKKSFPDHTVEIIDYSTRSAKKEHIKDCLRPLRQFDIPLAIETYRKNRMFNTFSNQLSLSRDHFISDKLGKIEGYISDNYDIVISGSDAVFSWNGKRFPTAYLLGGEDNITKLSYAASAHRLNYRTADHSYIEYCERAFKSYNYIGVRDYETERFVKYCFPEAIVHRNCDPTFLLDIDDIKERASVNFRRVFGINDDRPIIIVMSPDAKLGEAVMRQYSDRYNVVSVFINNPCIPKKCNTLTPFEWACVFSYADITITEYFHATILSLLNGTPTVSVDKLGLSSGYQGKIYNLLMGDLQLQELYINQDDVVKNGYSCITDRANIILEMDIRTRIERAISKEKEKFSDFQTDFRRIISERE